MQKNTVRLLLKKNKPNALKQLPIYLCITIESKRSYISTGHYILKSHWDEKNEVVKDSYAYASDINADIQTKKKEVFENIHTANYKKEVVSAHLIKERATVKDRTNIFSFKDRYLKEMENKRDKGTKDNWTKHLKKLEAYHGNTDLTFEQITASYLNGFEDWLRNGGIESDNDDHGNYIHAIMKSIRRLFNAAKEKNMIDVYPFGEYEIPKEKPGNKDHLSLKELDVWERFADTTTNKRLKEVANWFLFGCYTGLRVSDWFAFDFEKHVHKDYVSLKATKNDGMANIPLYRRLKETLKRVKATPLTVYEQDINDDLKIIAKELKINKHLSTHCARKTFAVTVCLDRQISSETAAHLMAITLAVFVKNYSRVTPEKVRKETSKAWKDL